MWESFSPKKQETAVVIVFYNYHHKVASQQDGSGFEPTGRLGSFCVEFACSPRACVGFLQVLRLPPTIQRHAG